jgi:hypothetical protein
MPFNPVVKLCSGTIISEKFGSLAVYLLLIGVVPCCLLQLERYDD